VVLMLVAIGLIGVLTATVASFFVGEKADEEQAALNQRLDRIEAMLAQALTPTTRRVRRGDGSRQERFGPAEDDRGMSGTTGKYRDRAYAARRRRPSTALVLRGDQARSPTPATFGRRSSRRTRRCGWPG